MAKGWRNESRRHSLAARGVKTSDDNMAKAMAKAINESGKWKKEGKGNTVIFSMYRQSAPKEKIRKELAIYEPSVISDGKFVVTAKAYKTREIGLKGEEGLISVMKDKTFKYKSEGRAREKANELRVYLTNEEYKKI